MATVDVYDVNDIIKEYHATRENFFKTQQAPEKIKYNSLTKLLRRTPLLGALKYGENYIA